MKFMTMKTPLQYDVKNSDGTIAIPRGTRRVQIAFRQSPLVLDKDTGKAFLCPYGTPLAENQQRMNVYRRFNSKTLVYG